MGMENFIQNFFNRMPIQAPEQKGPDTQFLDNQNKMPTLNANNPSGKGASVTYSPLSGQPKTGSPNQYSNTVGQWDNATIQPQSSSSGKGKGF